MSKIKAIIFDFDGVIAESVDIKTRAFAELFKGYPGELDKIVKLHLDHGGLSRYVKFEMIYNDILNKQLSENEKEKLGQQFSEFVFQEVVKSPYVKGAKEFLDKYYKTMKLFVVSGTPEEEIKSIVKLRNMNGYFKEVYGAPTRKGELCKEIMNDYKIDGDSVVFVGDSMEDYEGANESGIKFVGRLKDRDAFEGKKVFFMIKDLFELDKFIEEYNNA